MTKTPPGTEPRDTCRSVGETLRSRREELGWAMSEIAEWLCIRQGYLQALEAGRPQDLPGSAYAQGFLRSYASALGLDADAMSARFRNEGGDLHGRTDLRFPTAIPERGVPTGAALLLGGVLLVIAYAGWYVFGGQERLPAQSVPTLPQALAPYAADQNGRDLAADPMPDPGQMRLILAGTAAREGPAAARVGAGIGRPKPEH